MISSRRSCAFFCARKEANILKNEKFILTTGGEKRRKLGTILRSRTNDSLTREQMRFIIQSIAPGVQYEIGVFTEPSGFCDALVLESSGDMLDRGKIVFGQALFGRNDETGINPGRLFQEQDPAAAVITRSAGTFPETRARAILIYIPPDLYLKGTGIHEGQRIQKESCI